MLSIPASAFKFPPFPPGFSPKHVVFTYFLLPSMYNMCMCMHEHRGDPEIHVCYREKYMHLNINPGGSRSQNNPQVMLWSEQPVQSVNECVFPPCIWRALVAGNPLVCSRSLAATMKRDQNCWNKNVIVSYFLSV